MRRQAAKAVARKLGMISPTAAARELTQGFYYFLLLYIIMLYYAYL